MITIFSWILGAIKIAIVLGTLITIHELGHFTVAKLCKVKVNKFSIGFGPTILSKTSGDTEYTLKAIPFGGYVQMEGEEERSESEGAFNKKNVWQRIAIVLAGATVNIVFALIIYFFIALSNNFYSSTKVSEINNGPLYDAGIMAEDNILKVNNKNVLTSREIDEIIVNAKSDDFIFTINRDNENIDIPVKIEYAKIGYMGIMFADEKNVLYVVKNSPAEKAKILPGDIIESVNGVEYLTTEETTEAIRNIKEAPISLMVSRSGEIINLTGETTTQTQRYYMVAYYPLKPSFPQNIIYAIDETGYYFTATLNGMMEVLTGKAENVEVMGPIGIATEITKTSGLSNFFYLMSAISLSLGIFNLLPVPALDGGRIVILLIESIRRKPMKESIEQGLIIAGFGAIIILALFVTVADVIKIF